MAKPNYQYEKRQRELAKKKKKEEKKQNLMDKAELSSLSAQTKLIPSGCKKELPEGAEPDQPADSEEN
ncbi:MAG: hypothetical protein A2512_12745 [Deltaproteobacteria bacterium RIFOXYD12_FULL_56_24]|nr:MAG: hypothetical protein A2512_12745 [Deltaproteobacteria bacterium RIFOXYD12_FULL_56_24]